MGLLALVVVLALQQAALTRGVRQLDRRVVALEAALTGGQASAAGTSGAAAAAGNRAGDATALESGARGIGGLPVSPIPMEQLAGDAPRLGSASAPVTIIEFSDFACPYCQRFARETLPALVAQQVAAGTVQLRFRHFPLPAHPQARKAAEAATCAGQQGSFWEMHDLLFARRVDGGPPSFKRFAAELELDATRFGACLDTGATAASVQRDLEDGIAAGIRATPGFVVNGVVFHGAQPTAVFVQVIAAALQAGN